MNDLLKLMLYLIPTRKRDVVISMIRSSNNTGPSRFLNNLTSQGKLRYSKFGLINSKVFFVISNSSLLILFIAKFLNKKILVRVDGFSIMKRYIHVNETEYNSRKMS